MRFVAVLAFLLVLGSLCVSATEYFNETFTDSNQNLDGYRVWVQARDDGGDNWAIVDNKGVLSKTSSNGLGVSLTGVVGDMPAVFNMSFTINTSLNTGRSFIALSDGASNVVQLVAFSSGQFLAYDNASSNSVLAVAAGNVYPVRVEVNNVTRTYDLFINGTLEADDYGFVNEGNVDRVAFWTDDGGTFYHYVDDVYFNDTLLANFSVIAVDAINGSSIDSFSVRVVGDGSDVIYNSGGGGLVTTNILVNDTADYNVTIFNASGYHNRTYVDVDISVLLVGELFRLVGIHEVVLSNVSAFGGVNYSRVLVFSVNYSCPSWSEANLSVFVNGSLNNTVVGVSCENETGLLSNGSLVWVVEELVNVSFVLSSGEGDADSGNVSVFFDLYDPVASVNFTIPNGFGLVNGNFSLLCVDSVLANLTYNLSHGSSNLFYGNLSNGSVQSNNSVLSNGANVAVGVCYDLFGNDSDSFSDTAYSSSIILIDELNNTAFDVANISSAKVYVDDNSTVFDFQEEGNVSEVNFTSGNFSKLRFELVYSTGDVITRYVDVDLLDAPIRVCANREGVTHYEQLIISSSQRVAILKNVYSDCVVAADYTRFAYQDALVLKAFTVASMYYLYTFDEGSQVFLASVDGSIATYVNLDNLEFVRQGYEINVLGDVLATSKSGDEEVCVYYSNLEGDNEEVRIVITRLDTNVVLLNTTSVSDPDEFTLYFDYSTLSGVDNETLFKLEVFTVDGDGVEGTLVKYFNTFSQSGVLKNGLAMILAVFLSVAGFTFASSRVTFSWFGLALLTASLVVLTLAVGAWFINFMIMVDVVLMVWVGILMWNQNSATVA